MLDLTSRISIPLQVLGTLQFINLFVIAPVITETLSLSIAIFFALIAHFLLIVALFLILVTRRRDLSVGWLEVIWQVCECSLCPGYLANVRRRATLRWTKFEADALSLLASLPASDTLSRRHSIRIFVAELLEASDLEPAERQALLLYTDINEESDL